VPNYATGAAEAQYYFYNYQGDVMEVADSSGDLLYEYDYYDRFGDLRQYDDVQHTCNAPTDDIHFGAAATAAFARASTPTSSTTSSENAGMNPSRAPS